MRTSCHRLDLSQCFADLLHVIRQFERYRSGERQHGHALLGRYSAIQKLHHRQTDVPELTDVEMDVVDHECDETSRKHGAAVRGIVRTLRTETDRKSTRLNSSHLVISY